MFTIGEFSKINKISTRMLRHYDKIGLLKPAQIDKWTGYRYYSIQQIEELKKILTLKYLNFSLKTIKKMKENNYKNVDNFIKEHKKKLIVEMEDLNLKIATLHEFDITKNIINKIETQNFNFEVIESPEIYIYSKRYIIAHAIPTKIEDLILELKKEIQSKNIIPAGYPILFWHNKDFHPDASDLEIGFPVLNKKIATNYYPSQLSLYSFYTGQYDTILEYYTLLYHWINTNGHHSLIPTREIRYNYHSSNILENQLTLIIIPIKKAG